jgi:proline dehydrogenase
MPKYDIEVQLSGENGNAFAIIGRVVRALRKAKVSEEEIESFSKEAMSGNYDKLHTNLYGVGRGGVMQIKTLKALSKIMTPNQLEKLIQKLVFRSLKKWEKDPLMREFIQWNEHYMDKIMQYLPEFAQDVVRKIR